MINYFKPPNNPQLPSEFPSPFVDAPHALARQASRLLQDQLIKHAPFRHDFFADGNGKMFGVLVVEDGKGRLGYLAAFSGMLDDSWLIGGFAPPLFEQSVLDEFTPQGELDIKHIEQRLNTLLNDVYYLESKQQLELLEDESKRQQIALQNVHVKNKAARQLRREEAQINNDNNALVRLSFESQQDQRERRVLRVKLLEQVTKAEKAVVVFKEQITELEKERKRISRSLQKRLFDCYNVENFAEKKVALLSLFNPKMPPGGTGDCAAPKLLALAKQQALKPIALAEFWWGASPLSGVRHHKHFYPSCRGKCGPLLPFMLRGLEVQSTPELPIDAPEYEPKAVYEDDVLVVVNKPSGMLSVPGKTHSDSAELRMQKRYPEATGAMMVHRLDMSTSGLLLVAKTAQVHKNLQAQFIARSIKKRYVAILDGVLEADSGAVNLPLRVEIDDRPRQRVCDEHGKPALTHWEVIERTESQTRVWFYPLTGRTHQLRLHASHKRGLGAPIAGDELYGNRAGRLKLHAQRLEFDHPISGERLCVEVDAPF